MKEMIGIVLPFQNGDLITATSVLHYKDELWPNCDIVWFCNEPHSDALKFQDIEIRYFPHGWDILENDITGQYSDRVKKDKEDGKPEWEDWSVLKNSQNRLNQELKNKFNSFKDLEEAYFPTPWMLTDIQRHGLSYPEVSRKVFGLPNTYEWHPVLAFSDEERDRVNKFMYYAYKVKFIGIESYAGSGQSKITDENIRKAMGVCKEVFPSCEFVFLSHKYLNGTDEFPDHILERDDVRMANYFTVRQCALVVASCDILISVSSGITVAASCWGNRPVPIAQFTGSRICSTELLALGRFELIRTDGRTLDEASEDFYSKLRLLLNEIK